MFIFLSIILIIICVLLTLVVLAQNPQGGGLTPTFGGFSSNLMGARQSVDFMEKATWYLAIAIMVIVLASNFFMPTSGTKTEKSELQGQVQNELPAMPQQNMPPQQQQKPGVQQKQNPPAQKQPPAK